MAYRYRPEVLQALARHGVAPLDGTPPSRVRDHLNDLYRYEIRALRARLLRGEVARTIVGRDGTFTVRPEKIRLADPHSAPGPADVSALGRIREVAYVGPDTRYFVTLEAGPELVVTQQNLSTTSSEALAQRGRTVRLIWAQEHNFAIPDTRGGDT